MSSCEYAKIAGLASPQTTPDRHRQMRALAAVYLSALMSGLEISSVPATLPTLEAVLHARFADLQWIMAYVIGTTVLMATGALADRFGRKRVFAIAIALFGLTSLACGFADGASLLIAARAMQGAAGGAMLICLVAVLSHQFPPGPSHSRAFGAWGIVFGVGLGFGPLIGATIGAWADGDGSSGCTRCLPSSRSVSRFRACANRAIRRRGRSTCAAWSRCRRRSLRSSGPSRRRRQRGSFTWARAVLAGGVCLALFVLTQLRSDYPMFDFVILRIPAFSGALLGSAAMNFSF